MFLQAREVAQYIENKCGVKYAVSYIRWLFGMKVIPSQKIRGKRGIYAKDLENFLPNFIQNNKKSVVSKPVSQ